MRQGLEIAGSIASVLLANAAIVGLLMLINGEEAPAMRRFFSGEVIRCYGDERPVVRMEETLKGYTVYIEDCGIPDGRLDNR